MKKIGLMIALFGLASGAIYASTRLFNTTKNMIGNNVGKVKATKKSVGENTKVTPNQSSISKSYTYVAEDF